MFSQLKHTNFNRASTSSFLNIFSCRGAPSEIPLQFQNGRLTCTILWSHPHCKIVLKYIKQTQIYNAEVPQLQHNNNEMYRYSPNLTVYASNCHMLIFKELLSRVQRTGSDSLTNPTPE